MIDSHHGWNKSFTPLIVGFVLSLICTIAAYLIVADNFLRPYMFLVAVAVLGFVQTIIQLIFFFHLGIEEKPRWNFLLFLFMALVVVLVIGGSIWIMDNLNKYTMM
jgi:cytochrome o ubiquinol oxidase subunit IV